MAVIRLTRALWREYVHQNRVKAAKQAAENKLRRKREALIVEHMPLAARIARQVWHRFNLSRGITADGHVDANGGGYRYPIALEDMISCAYVGLVEAAGRWDPTKGDFEKYCYLRVRGAIVDAHRRQNYLETQHSSVDEWIERAHAAEHVGGEGEGRGRANTGREQGNAYMMARYLSDPRPLADDVANVRELRHQTAAAIERLLSDDERAVILQALSGSNVSTIGREMGHSPAWARERLASARKRLAAVVQKKVA